METTRKGLHFVPMFATDGHPFDGVEWELRTAEIKDEKGNTIFRQEGVEFPSTWSQLATNVVASKFFFGRLGSDERETSVKQILTRVANWIADSGSRDGYFADASDVISFRNDLLWLLLHQHGSFNSPVWFNVGVNPNRSGYGIAGDGSACPASDLVNPRYQCSACFILGIDDTMESIAERATTEMMIFKDGSGAGCDNSKLRSSRERISGGGKASGPISFLRIYDSVAAVTKSGGKTRRAAKMETLKCVHPDIMEFIFAKGSEEKKAKALIAQGYEANFNGEAYSSVLFQNSNFSVRATDDFLERVEDQEDLQTLSVVTGTRFAADGTEMPLYGAREVMDAIATQTWACGDPGMQYEDTIQRWHTCPNTYTCPNTSPINSSNPCSEYMFIDDSACNLASLNLMKFRKPDGSIDIISLRHACRIFITAQEILVDSSAYPTRKIAQNSHDFRPLGLGFANLGSLVMASGLAYDSDEGRSLAGAVSAVMGGQAYLTSAEIASIKGPFNGFEANRDPMLRVIQQHWDAALDQFGETSSHYKLWQEACLIWSQAHEEGSLHGYRNSQVTVIAPTGTIGFMMDCDTTGIEPSLGLIQYKTLAGGGNLKIVNQTVPEALRKLGYSDGLASEILSYIDKNGTIEGCPDLALGQSFVFDCAFPANGDHSGRAIAWRGHLRMMAAVQPFVSGAISKTINMPRDSTVDDIREAYLEGWRLGLKAVAIYRDGSKDSQPVSTKKEDGDDPERHGGSVDSVADDPLDRSMPRLDEDRLVETIIGSNERLNREVSSLRAQVEEFKIAPRRLRLPDTRSAVTHKFSVGGHEGYLTVGEFPDGRPGELFIQMAKEGSTVGGLMDTIGVLISIGLQYGVPLDVLATKLSNQRFEPNGSTHDKDIPFASSLIDYVIRWMGMRYIDGYREEHAPNRSITSISVTPHPIDESVIPVLSSFGGNGSAVVTVQVNRLDCPPCDDCGSITVPSGRCFRCVNCGSTTGCS